MVPFALNSAELFERWAQLKLLESPMFSGAEAGGKRRTTYAGEGGNVSVRPDFWIPARDGKEGMILDAKYKLAPESVADIQDKDIYQMVAYSRHRRFVEEKLGAKREDSISLALLYPEIRGGDIEPSKPDKSFYAPLSWWTVPCPAKSERGSAALAA